MKYSPSDDDPEVDGYIKHTKLYLFTKGSGLFVNQITDSFLSYATNRIYTRILNPCTAQRRRHKTFLLEIACVMAAAVSALLKYLGRNKRIGLPDSATLKALHTYSVLYIGRQERQITSYPTIRG